MSELKIDVAAIEIAALCVLGGAIDKSDPLADPLGDRSYVGIKIAGGHIWEFQHDADDHALANRVADDVRAQVHAKVTAAIAAERKANDPQS